MLQNFILGFGDHVQIFVLYLLLRVFEERRGVILLALALTPASRLSADLTENTVPCGCSIVA